jgi:hypothetical protein
MGSSINDQEVQPEHIAYYITVPKSVLPFQCRYHEAHHPTNISTTASLFRASSSPLIPAEVVIGTCQPLPSDS